ncbi:MAG: hypothetical protein MRY74_14910 [Neomegalonema sp.]|nr:hypothetical protein [Neomegalonema sp.]
MRIRSLAAAALIALSAPAAAENVIRAVEIETPYSRLSVSRATAHGALIEIYGAPEGGEEEMAAHLSLPGWFADKPFRVIEFDPEDDRIDRIVLVFGPAPAGDRICHGDPRRIPSFGTRAPTTATVAFCDGFEVESRATLFSSDLAYPGSPRFKRAMGLLFAKALPRRNPNRDRYRCKRKALPC